MINKEKKIATLPTDVIEYLNNSILFNKFGVVNLRAVRGNTTCELKDRELKRLINDKFKKEMVTGKIEFITNKKK